MNQITSLRMDDHKTADRCREKAERLRWTEYDQQAEDFLRRHRLAFKTVKKADRCPLWCDDKHIHGDRYIIRIISAGRAVLSFSFWTSKRDAELELESTAYGVLSCITKDNPGTFEDFCGNFGYSTDSRKALKTYGLVKKEWERVSRFFTEQELKELHEIV